MAQTKIVIEKCGEDLYQWTFYSPLGVPHQSEELPKKSAFISLFNMIADLKGEHILIIDEKK